MKHTLKDPWIDMLLRRPGVRTKLSFFFIYAQVAIYVSLVAGLLIFIYLILNRPG